MPSLAALTDILSPAALAGAAAAFLVAAVVRGFTGFGFALVAVPLASLMMAPARAVPVVFLLQLIVGAYDTARYHRDWDRGFVMLALGAIVATPAGVYLLAIASPATARLTVAALMLGGTALLWRPPRLPLRPSRRLAALAGFGAGLSNGLAAMPGPPAVAYTLLTDMPAHTARVSLMVLFFITSLAGLPSAYAFGIADRATLLLAASALPILFFGTLLGERLFHRFGTQAYRQVTLVILAATALVMIGRELLAFPT